MKIRLKLLLLLLVFSTTTLLASTLFSQLTFYRSGMHLAEETERTLADQAHRSLRELVRSFQRQQSDDQRILEFALSNSAAGDGLSRGEDSPRWDTPPPAFSTLEDYRPGTVSHQFTIFESGQTLIYPPVEGLFDGTDLGQLAWYQTVRNRQGVTRTLAKDPNDGRQTVIFAKALRDKSGTFLGATALIRPLSTIFADLQLSDVWRNAARELLVVSVPRSGADPGALRILAVRDNGNGIRPWNKLQIGDLLRPDRWEDNRQLLDKVAAGQGGALRLDLQGQAAHWIFSAGRDAEPFALILVPHNRVIARAIAAKQHVVNETIRGLKFAGVLLGLTVVAVFFTATLASKKVTQPLDRLSAAAEHLAAGNFHSRVAIKTGDEIEALGQVFNRLGPALAERERMAHSLALAGDIQRHLLPLEQPGSEQFELFGGTLPCDETGGDYYDFIPLDESHRLALTLGDVSGHGVGAALLMASARGVLRSHAPNQGLSLPQLFSTLNRHLCRDTADEQFMTLFYAVLDFAERSLHWCSAGHGPIFLYRKEHGKIYELGSTGLPLGILTDSYWDEGPPLFFQPGDTLLIGTDGIWEAQNQGGEQLGLEGFKELIQQHANLSAEQLHSTVLAGVNRFRQGQPQDDDVTLIVLKAQ